MLPGTTLFGVVLILIIVVSLIILLIRKPHIPLPFSFEEKSSKGKEEEPSERVEALKPQTTPPKSLQARPPECPHFLGYLRKIPKNTPIPDECFGCPKMVECLYYSSVSE